jgi:DNA ligase 1
MIKKPMLAGKLDKVESILFPVLATPKLDGIRCLRLNSKSVSRKLIDIPNGYIQKMMESLPDGLDGELIVLDTEFNQTQSEIMSESGEPNFRYYVFDYVSGDLKKTYSDRMEDLKKLELPEFCVKLLPVTINSIEEFNNYEQVCLKNNYEGVMIRTPSGPYKCGRSTEKEAYLLKYKRFEDSDAEIIGMEALFSNGNEKELDQMGYTKRSKKNSGLKEEETLGSLSVRDVHSGVEFSLGTGFTEKQRKEIWDKKSELIGKFVKYRFQPAGVKEKPRFPSFISFRDERDL